MDRFNNPLKRNAWPTIGFLAYVAIAAIVIYVLFIFL